ncbi:MAG: hypothetical protein J0H40_13555 [Rhizobiales bacterium]|nr:hypothetical protein [Hyphomicrobiales bacterium]
MAKSSVGTKAPSRIRFVMVEAELGDGDIGQITQAIQNALRPPQPVATKRITAPLGNGNGEQHVEIEPFDEEEDVETVDVAPNPPRQRAPRKAPKAPDVVDIDMNAEVSLAAFAAGKDAGSQHKKYMIAAAWLKECRGISAVGAGHIYTCFRSMNWSANIPDFWQPLRDLKAKKYFVKNDAGDYEINHLGLDYVKKKLGGGRDGAE